MKNNKIGDLVWLAGLVLVTAFLIIPSTNRIFIQLTGRHPYAMGFVKFAILASMGELLALRLTTRKWSIPGGMGWRVLVWGCVGVAITFMFTFYSNGVSAMVAKGSLPVGSGLLAPVLTAFYTSLIMNLTFGPVFMAAHRISDAAIEARTAGKKTSWMELLASIRWHEFISFVVGKTIPLWWIPVHTITFLLPTEYRVLAAGYLSIALGVILSYAKQKSTQGMTVMSS